MENEDEILNILWPELHAAEVEQYFSPAHHSKEVFTPVHDNYFYQEVGPNHEHLHHLDNEDVIAVMPGEAVPYFPSEGVSKADLFFLQVGQNPKHLQRPDNQNVVAVELGEADQYFISGRGSLEELSLFENGQISEHLGRPHNKDVEVINSNDHPQETAVGHFVPPPLPPPIVPLDSEEYREYLKSRLQFECAVVAFIRANRAGPQNSIPTNMSQLNLHEGGRHDTPNVKQDASLIVSKKSSKGKDESSIMIRPHFDRNKADATQTHDGKRKRRRLQNQESAKRSRRRKLEQGIPIEARVNLLRQEKSELMKQLSNIFNTSNEECLHNKALETQVAILKAQVDMLEEMVKTATKFSYSSDIHAPGDHSIPSTL